MIKVFSVSEGLPDLGKPVLISAYGETQDVTYVLDSDGVNTKGFRPYHFSDGRSYPIPVSHVSLWAYIPELSAHNGGEG